MNLISLRCKMAFLLLQHTVNEKISQERILNEQSNRLPSQLGEKKINRKVGIPLSSLLIHHKVSFLVSNIQLQGWAHSLFWTKHKKWKGKKCRTWELLLMTIFLKSKDMTYKIQTALSLVPAVEEDERVDQKDWMWSIYGKNHLSSP